ncbi:PREDICTED: uncharacterized protein LOC104748634 [Camelina sativa]|uniref:Uncharacterized protein LOC104748634 n=1 Tax=Camelina sativa TaxID=90675 RepID=A0ABM0WBC6_CAMSA|nr:PREDICTED: uncharacterized protein LOC104748634 [Camelina sativa]
MLKLEEDFHFRVYKSEPSLLVVKCTGDKSCKWMIRASKIDSTSERFTVRKYVSVHTCPLESRKPGRVTARFISQLFQNDRGEDGDNSKPADISSMMLIKYGFEMTYWNSWKSLEHMKESVRGTAESGYERLPAYIHLIKKYNPGTIAYLEKDVNDRFKYLFISFGACIQGFKFLRKVIVVDGSFLKGKYEGILLVATAQDGNYKIFPVAFGIVDSEDNAAWEWFFNRLREVIPDSPDLVIISDRHKSIAKAITKVYPTARRGICTYHLKKNIITKFRGSENLGLVKQAANAYSLPEFEDVFRQIRHENPRLANYLEKAGFSLWSRAHFSGNRYNVTTSNIAESINGALKKARELPIVYFLQYVGDMLSRWFYERRLAAALYEANITPRVDKMLKQRSVLGKHLKVRPINTYRFQVKLPTGDCVVDFEHKTCTCRRFDVHKIPCVHAIAAARKTSLTWESLVSRHYTKTCLFGAYAQSISPIEEWLIPPEIAVQACRPPKMRKRSGRRKKRRYKSALENATQAKRPRKKHACSNCGVSGHNCKTCLF